MLTDTGRSTQAILSRAHSTPADQCKCYLLSIASNLMVGLGYNLIRCLTSLPEHSSFLSLFSRHISFKSLRFFFQAAFRTISSISSGPSC
jgi:hypothetical protein